jgi:hypothetical protein
MMIFGGSLHCFAEEKEKNIDSKAEWILRQMSEYLAGAEQFTYHADHSFDVVLETGQKLMYTASSEASVRRPDRFQVNIKGDLRNLRFWYDGKTVTLFEPKLNFYAITEAPPHIDAALDHAAAEFGITAPAADLVLSDPYAALIGKVQSGFYAGLHEIFGVKCHHLAFTQEDIDWQIWIEDGRMVVPRMLVLTYKKVEGSPQYTAVISDWNLTPRLPDSLFTFLAPEGAQQIRILPIDSLIPGKIK